MMPCRVATFPGSWCSWVFSAIIAGALLVLNVAQRWLGEMLKLKLRQGLVQDLVQNWLVPGRAFRIANAGDIGVNPDQRMHEDARHLTELSADLGIGLLQGSILLITFINILWGISSGFVFHVAGRTLAIPGYMVWAAVIYAASASLVSFWVGRSLIERNAERYAREAELRFSLVRVNEHIDAIALAGGEAEEARRIELDLAGVLLAMRRLITGLMNLTWVTAGYGWFTLVAPILAAAPLYFAGTLSFGGLMMASGAFVQVQSSLRWFVDNASTLADWRATLLRVASFRRALLGADVLHHVESQIAFVEGEPGRIVMDHLEIASPSGCTKLEETYVEVKAGERVLIVGQAGTGTTLPVPGARRPVVMGCGPRRTSHGRNDAVHPAQRLFASRHAARDSRLPLARRELRCRGVPACARAARLGSPGADARSIQTLGPYLGRRRATESGICAGRHSRAALAPHR